jgi:hypothetical protein
MPARRSSSRSSLPCERCRSVRGTGPARPAWRRRGRPSSCAVLCMELTSHACIVWCALPGRLAIVDTKVSRPFGPERPLSPYAANSLQSILSGQISIFLDNTPILELSCYTVILIIR